MFHKNELMAALARSQKNNRQMAAALGINVATLSAKINGHREFTRDEINDIAKFLDLSNQELIRIFFA